MVELRDSKMGPGDIKPIAIALVVSIGFPLTGAFIAMFIKTNTSIFKKLFTSENKMLNIILLFFHIFFKIKYTFY